MVNALSLRCPHIHSLSATAGAVSDEAMELPTGRIEGKLLLFGRPVGDQWPAFIIDHVNHDLSHGALPQSGRFVQS